MRQRFSRMELGKPDAGKPPVRFDEGREADGHWPCASQSVASRLPLPKFSTPAARALLWNALRPFSQTPQNVTIRPEMGSASSPPAVPPSFPTNLPESRRAPEFYSETDSHNARNSARRWPGRILWKALRPFSSTAQNVTICPEMGSASSPPAVPASLRQTFPKVGARLSFTLKPIPVIPEIQHAGGPRAFVERSRPFLHVAQNGPSCAENGSARSAGSGPSGKLAPAVPASFPTILPESRRVPRVRSAPARRYSPTALGRLRSRWSGWFSLGPGRNLPSPPNQPIASPPWACFSESS